MWRYLVGAVGALLLAGAGMLVFRGGATGERALLPAMPQSVAAASPLPDDVPEASAKTREERRFGRYDKDKDGKITRDEYLASRHKAFAKLDVNHDGMLGFDEWAAKTEAKFATADADHSGAMSPIEFASTAVKRKAPRTKPCGPADKSTPSDDDAG